MEVKTTYVYADIETETLRAEKLLQIAAISETNITFSVHINPRADLPKHCTDITGLYFYNNNLYKNGRLVPSTSIHNALDKFNVWISQFPKVNLVFHNGFSFDIRVLLKHYARLGRRFPSNIEIIHDTLPAFRKKIPVSAIKNHQLGTLATFTNTQLISAHDALHDAEALKNICESFCQSENISISEFLSLYQKPISLFLESRNPSKIKAARK